MLFYHKTRSCAPYFAKVGPALLHDTDKLEGYAEDMQRVPSVGWLGRCPV